LVELISALAGAGLLGYAKRLRESADGQRASLLNGRCDVANDGVTEALSFKGFRCGAYQVGKALGNGQNAPIYLGE